MKKLYTLIAIAFLIGFAVSFYRSTVNAGEDRGQQIIDAYLDPAVSSPEKTTFHRALSELLHEGSDQPGSIDISDLRSVYAMPIGKSSLMTGWTTERKTRLWKMNFALGFARYDLSADQQQYLIELAAALPMTAAQSKPWEDRAVKLFSRDVGRGLFATIGDGRCPGQFAAAGKPKILATCVCTTNAGNWSCNDSCHSPGTCNVDPGNCGFLWLYDCNGMCNNSNEGN